MNRADPRPRFPVVAAEPVGTGRWEAMHRRMFGIAVVVLALTTIGKQIIVNAYGQTPYLSTPDGSSTTTKVSPVASLYGPRMRGPPHRRLAPAAITRKSPSTSRRTALVTSPATDTCCTPSSTTRAPVISAAKPAEGSTSCHRPATPPDAPPPRSQVADSRASGTRGGCQSPPRGITRPRETARRNLERSISDQDQIAGVTGVAANVGHSIHTPPRNGRLVRF